MFLPRALKCFQKSISAIRVVSLFTEMRQPPPCKIVHESFKLRSSTLVQIHRRRRFLLFRTPAHLRSASPRSHKEAAAADLHPSPWAHQHNLISSRRAPRVTFENHSHNSYPLGSVGATAIFWGKLGNSAGKY